MKMIRLMCCRLSDVKTELMNIYVFLIVFITTSKFIVLLFYVFLMSIHAGQCILLFDKLYVKNRL